MKEDNLMGIIDNLIAEDKEVIDEFIKEELQPLIDYKVKQAKRAFEKEYQELLDLEKEV